MDGDLDEYASQDSGGADCNDYNPNVNPGVLDFLGDNQDTNCDGHEGTDLDGDGFASDAGGGTDCNDDNPAVHPDSIDSVGNGVDDNCDGEDGVDADGDGFASLDSGGDDCNDSSTQVNPDAPELCHDATDNNCNGDVDESGLTEAPITAGSAVTQADCEPCDPENVLTADGDVAGLGINGCFGSAFGVGSTSGCVKVDFGAVRYVSVMKITGRQVASTCGSNCSLALDQCEQSTPLRVFTALEDSTWVQFGFSLQGSYSHAGNVVLPEDELGDADLAVSTFMRYALLCGGYQLAKWTKHLEIDYVETVGCEAGSCDPPGIHECSDGSCYSDEDPLHCGPDCDQCPEVDNGASICEDDACDYSCNQGFEKMCSGCYSNDHEEKCGGCYLPSDPDHCGDECLECWVPTQGAELSCPADKPEYCCYSCPGSDFECCLPADGSGIFMECWKMDCTE